MPSAPRAEFTPETSDELARYLRDNAAGVKRPVIPAGGRTALDYGRPVPADSTPLAMTRLSRVIDYPARDMTITVEAGIRIHELAGMLRTERQQLPIDVPQSHRATLGGILACNVSGSHRYGYGTLRDYVIGITAIDGTGRVFHSGGRVVKNVAGYDLCKLLVGSLGTLAVISQVTLKLKPLPESTGLLWATYDSFAEIDDALHRLLTSAARPVILDVLSADAARQLSADCRRELPSRTPVLVLGVEGSPRDVAWQIEALTRELAPLGPDDLFSLTDEESAPIRAAMTEFPVGGDEPLSFKASLVPSAAMPFAELAANAGVSLQIHAGNGIVQGHFPESTGTLPRARDLAATLLDAAKRASGNLVVTRCESRWKPDLPVFGESLLSQKLSAGLRAAFDPHAILNRGRLLDVNVP